METGKAGLNLVDVAAAAPAKKTRKPRASKDLVSSLKARIAALENQISAETGDASTLSTTANKKRIRIRIEQARDSTEPNPVYIGVNGRGYHIKRGTPVDVPPEVAHVLDIAIAGVGVPLEGGGVEFVDSMRVPYHMLGVSVDENGERLMKELPYQVKVVLA